MHSNIFGHISKHILSCAELKKEENKEEINYENIPKCLTSGSI